jgi:hypothetical protein
MPASQAKLYYVGWGQGQWKVRSLQITNPRAPHPWRRRLGGFTSLGILLLRLK